MDYSAEAERMFRDNDFQWRVMFAFHLHQVSPTLAVRWSILCIQEIGAVRFPQRLLDFAADLEVAQQHLNEFPNTDDPEKMEYEIWYRPNRDEIQTAVSKLFTSVRELHEPKSCVWSCGAVVSNLVQDNRVDLSKSGCTSKPLFDLVRICYRRILETS